LSVGSAVSSSSLVCGGSTLTASDVAVLLHDRLPGLKCRAEVPPASAVLSAADSSLLQDAWQVCLPARSSAWHTTNVYTMLEAAPCTAPLQPPVLC
jgi:hypothetical protein